MFSASVKTLYGLTSLTETVFSACYVVEVKEESCHIGEQTEREAFAVNMRTDYR